MEEVSLSMDEYDRYSSEITAVTEAVGQVSRHMQGSIEDISRLVQSLQPLPVNVLNPARSELSPKTLIVPTSTAKPAASTTTAKLPTDDSQPKEVASKAKKPPRRPKAVPAKAAVVKQEVTAVQAVRLLTLITEL